MRRAAALAITIALSFAAVPRAHAVDLQQWKPAPGEEDVLAVQSPRLGTPYAWHFVFAANYADRPFRLVRIGSNRTVANVISHQTSLDLGGAWTWRNLFEVGAVVPLTINQTVGGAGALDPGLPSSVPKTAFGDVRLVAKTPIAEVAGTTLAFGLPLSLPTSRGDSFLGHEGLTARPRLLAGRSLGRVSLVADAGVALRAAETFRNFDQATAIDLGVGAAIRVPVKNQDLSALLTASGEWGLAQNGIEEKPLELLGAVRWHERHGLDVSLGGGKGLTAGAGTPDYRVFGLASMTFGEPPPHFEEPPPDIGEVKIEKPKNRILITSPVHFATGKDIILEESFPILEKVADKLKANPWIHRIRVEGHTDNQGDPKYNLDLSQLRAISVARFLVQHGVEPDILVPVGFGITKPIESNDTAAGRAHNRRVEFVILETDEGVTVEDTGANGTEVPAPPTPAPSPSPE